MVPGALLPSLLLSVFSSTFVGKRKMILESHLNLYLPNHTVMWIVQKNVRGYSLTNFLHRTGTVCALAGNVVIGVNIKTWYYLDPASRRGIARHPLAW